MQQETSAKSEGMDSAGQANACPISSETQEHKKVTFDCPPSGAASDCALCPAEVKRRCIPPIIDAEQSNAALVMVKQLRGRAA